MGGTTSTRGRTISIDGERMETKWASAVPCPMEHLNAATLVEARRHDVIDRERRDRGCRRRRLPKKSAPTLSTGVSAPVGSQARRSQGPSNRGLSNLDAELEQFPVDAGGPTTGWASQRTAAQANNRLRHRGNRALQTHRSHKPDVGPRQRPCPCRNQDRRDDKYVRQA
jgi:hypothetical protein